MFAVWSSVMVVKFDAAAFHTGAVLAAGVLNVNVLADWSVSWPAFAVPPVSCTWNVKEA